VKYKYNLFQEIDLLINNSLAAIMMIIFTKIINPKISPDASHSKVVLLVRKKPFCVEKKPIVLANIQTNIRVSTF